MEFILHSSDVDLFISNWSDLISNICSCAFKNTPKFKQVRSSSLGVIVKKSWIECCASERRKVSTSSHLLVPASSNWYRSLWSAIIKIFFFFEDDDLDDDVIDDVSK